MKRRMSRVEGIEAGVKLILDEVAGPKWEEDENFAETPARVAKAYREMLTPGENNWKTFPAKDSDMVILRGHTVYGFCPHHLFPFEARANVGYIPNKLTLGLSKLARVVTDQLTVPILQEDLSNKIADMLNEKLDPKGVGVVIAGIHGCMRCRGVRSGGDVVTSAMRGVLLLNPTARMEFLQLVGRP